MLWYYGKGTTREEDAQGTPPQSHTSPSILVYEDTSGMVLLNDRQLDDRQLNYRQLTDRQLNNGQQWGEAYGVRPSLPSAAPVERAPARAHVQSPVYD